jgi:hypothetical protein
MQAIYPNKDVYSGSHKAGVKHGKGNYIYSKEGLTYRGDWVNNRRQGNGELTGNGIIASGTFDDDQFVKGDYQDAEGTVFKTKKDPDGTNHGFFSQGRLNGYGTAEFKCGDIYNGYFKEGKRNG